MKLTNEQADILMDLLDVSTAYNWQDTIDGIKDRGYSPEEVHNAWNALQNISSFDNMAPLQDDFE